MMNFLSWLIGSKAGRIAALVGLTILSAFFVLRAAFNKGALSEKTKQTTQSLKILRERIAIDDEISKKPLDARRSELARWMRVDQ